jgi:hypothetical protein
MPIFTPSGFTCFWDLADHGIPDPTLDISAKVRWMPARSA